MLSLVQVVVWLIIGLLGGSLAGLLIKRERTGFGILRNLGLGLVGAFVGGLLFRLFGLFSELDRITISLRDRGRHCWIRCSFSPLFGHGGASVIKFNLLVTQVQR